jgi:uncharacterized protein (TIGR00255 family)
MINSMTAFAREQHSFSNGTLIIELRSVNHRYLDCTFKLPEMLRALEPSWREAMRNRLSRGKVECQARWQVAEGNPAPLQVNRELLQNLASACGEVKKVVQSASMPDALEMLKWPGVLDSGEADDDEFLKTAKIVFGQALDTLIANRTREGGMLGELIEERLQQVQTEVERCRAQMPQLLQRQREKIEARIQEISAELDPHRLEQELVLLANKADVDEELDRLQTHVVEVRRALENGGPCGRRLDFLMQELNREANTLSSKSISSSSTQNAVELKVLIEQMREQIQNLE